MIQPSASRSTLGRAAVFLSPLALWAMLYAGLLGGDIKQIVNPNDPTAFFNGLRAGLPLLAVYLAVIVILNKMSRQIPPGFRLFGPLGLLFLYGAIGIVASLLSPKGFEAFYWATLYLSVPLALWAITWGSSALGNLRNVIVFNWALVLIGVVTLLTIALLYSNLSDMLTNPRYLISCGDRTFWHAVTDGTFRSTGVGRYAAIGALISLVWLFRVGRWRYLWAVVLGCCLILLLHSGSRTAFVALGVSFPFAFLLVWQKRAAAIMILGALILAPIVWTSSYSQSFLQDCLVRGDNTPAPLLKELKPIETPQVTSPSVEENPLAATRAKEPSSQNGDRSVLILKLRVQENAGLQSLPPITAQLGPSPGENGAPGVVLRLGLPEGVSLDTPPSSVLYSASNLTDGTEGTIASVVVVRAQPQGSSLQEGTSGVVVQTRLLDASLQEDGTSLVTLELVLVRGISQNGVGSFQPNSSAGLLGEAAEKPKNSEAAIEPPALLSWSVLTLTGRTKIWGDGWILFKQSPALGFGFHADRFVLGRHIHNAFFHALLQTGILGTIPFVAGLALGWVFLLRLLKKRHSLPEIHQTTVIQVASVLAFFSVRAITESTGAFFSVDWLLLAPLLLYLQVAHRTAAEAEISRWTP